MVASFWTRVRFPLSTSFHQDLQKVAEFGNKDLPTQLLDSIVEASADYHNRCEIMTFVRECFAGPHTHKEWRRVYGALLLVEEVVRRGDSCLLAETAEGRHFDLMQQLSLLQYFTNPDTRVQNLVRSKASTVRSELGPKLQHAIADSCPNNSDDVVSQGQASTCTNSSISHHTTQTEASHEAAREGSADSTTHFETSLPMINRVANSRVVLNGIVTVGHNEDTSDESSGDEASPADTQHRLAKPPNQASLHHRPWTPQTSAQAIDSNLLDL
eukprot:gnl/MRDRNA2_/MRDRNA2_134687_c0_seq1.p1 gnl/MRDRNA2_/MRDRNA2_134687_c0~~gnl/MRDRNA2_/MRDRNA2_134687_c0_seq1.p1  ORF type:complete len:271 (-),score=35.62 gnl/MRDRNA2_/MRDRNA2_134687_c0_seq1:259-1071(-)